MTAVAKITKGMQSTASWAEQQSQELEQQLQSKLEAVSIEQAEQLMALETKHRADLQKVLSIARTDCEAQLQQMRDDLDAIQTEHDAQIQMLRTAFLDARSDTEKAWKLQLQHAQATSEAARAAQDAAFKAERLEWQQQMEQLKAGATEIADLARRRQQDSNQLRYIVRGQENTAGSVPFEIFGAEPDSLLAKMFNNEWAYATDDQGRALINSNPAHWPLILDWLSFGIVPTDPTEAFGAECEYWQLTNLLEQIEQIYSVIYPNSQEQAVPAAILMESKQHLFSLTSIASEGCHGFQLEGKFHHFCEGLATQTTFEITFYACGRHWHLSKFGISQYGAYLQRLSGPSVQEARLCICYGTGYDQWWHLPYVPFQDQPDGWGRPWAHNNLQKLQRCPYLDLHGSSQVTVQLLFQMQD